MNRYSLNNVPIYFSDSLVRGGYVIAKVVYWDSPKKFHVGFFNSSRVGQIHMTKEYTPPDREHLEAYFGNAPEYILLGEESRDIFYLDPEAMNDAHVWDKNFKVLMFVGQIVDHKNA